MARATPTIRDTTLLVYEAGQTLSFAVGSDQWFEWLGKDTSTVFSVHMPDGSYTARKERAGNRRGGWYWKAYRTFQGKLYRAYLGKLEDLTLARLHEVALTLSQRIQEQTEQMPEKTSIPSRQYQSLSDTSFLPLLETKLVPPRLPDKLVERPHLLTRLDTSFAYKLTLVMAPAGFGKSTLVNQWLTALTAHISAPTSHATSWISLDGSDNDVLRFWYTVMTACQKLLRQEQCAEGQAAVELLMTPFRSPLDAPSLELALTRLLNALADSSSGGWLVLDNYQVISEPLLHETFTFFLDHLPANVHVVLLSRTEPLQLPLLRWRARGELLELHTADLRFSSEETATFVQQALSIPLSDGTLKQLDATLEGWIAGLRLLTLTLSRQTTPHTIELAIASLDKHTALSSSYQPLMDYFITEILNVQPEHIQRFLLQTSVLSRMNASLCNAITGEENGTALLEAMAHDGLFLEALDEVEEWYHMHALFSEALSREAARRLGEETLCALSLRASSWYEHHAMLTEAVEAALQAHHFERAAILIEQSTMHGQSAELHTIHHWLEVMPEMVLLEHPMLCWLAALSLQVLHEEDATHPFENSRVEALLQMAEEGWHQQGNQDISGLIPALRAIQAWKSKQFVRAMEYAQQALAQWPNGKQDRRVQQFRGICLFIVGTALMYEGQFSEARSCFQQAYESTLITDDRHFAAAMFLLVGACNDASGELHQAHECYRQALSMGRKQGDREIIAQALQNLARLAFEWNDLTTAEQHVHEAQALALESDQDLHNSLDLQRALLTAARGRVTSAQQQMSALLARLQMSTTPEASLRLPDVLLASARLALEVNDVEAVKRLLEMPNMQNHSGVSIMQARLSLSQEKPREALLELESLLPTIQNRRESIEIRIVLALAHTACQEKDEARYWLKEALSLARAEGFVRLFLSEGEPLVRLLRHLIPTIEEKELRTYAQSILRASAQTFQEHIPGTTTSETLLIEPLSAQEQRVLRLVVAGETNRQIAQELVVSVNTVKDHLKHLYNKLGVNNRLQASDVARRLNLLP